MMDSWGAYRTLIQSWFVVTPERSARLALAGTVGVKKGSPAVDPGPFKWFEVFPP